jgi:CRP-like cAMP-binding protein
MITNGTELRYLFCLLEGHVSVSVAGQEVAKLGPGRFVGEMSLLTRSLTRADVHAQTNLKLLVWPHEEIESWVGSDPSRLTLLQTALGSQIVDELLRQQAAPTRLPEAG